MNKLLSLAIALALGAGPVANAQAVTQSLGTLSATPATANFTPNGSFSDIVNFSLGATSSVQGQVSNWLFKFGGNTVWNIASMSVDLYADTSTTPMASYLWTSSADNTDLGFSLPSVATGNYHLGINGATSGSAGGGYTVSMSAAPVPEPSDWLLMLSGLGLIGFIAARRRIDA